MALFSQYALAAAQEAIQDAGLASQSYGDKLNTVSCRSLSLSLTGLMDSLPSMKSDTESPNRECRSVQALAICTTSTTPLLHSLKGAITQHIPCSYHGY